MNVPKEAYPLTWPEGWKRTPFPQPARFGKWNRPTTIASARDSVMHELKLLQATDVIVSSNLALKRNGEIAGGQMQPADKGVSVWFKWKGQKVMASDKWARVEHNLHAIALSIQALRGLARWGSSDILERSFTGYAALPASTGKAWWDVLKLPINADEGQIRVAYQALAMEAHPDRGGSHDDMVRLNLALEEALRT